MGKSALNAQNTGHLINNLQSAPYIILGHQAAACNAGIPFDFGLLQVPVQLSFITAVQWPVIWALAFCMGDQDGGPGS